ncbi:hypothetical protein G6F43_010427 [Rhizopus delemar]|nr:hypothetical protein G6F43_010427 [Rhizopus delemar]
MSNGLYCLIYGLKILSFFIEAAPNDKNANIPLTKNKDHRSNDKNATQKILAKYDKHRSASSFFNPVFANGIDYTPVIDYYNDIEWLSHCGHTWRDAQA